MHQRKYETSTTESTNHTSVNCPQCDSGKVWRDGIRKSPSGVIQRYICRLCGFRFSETTKPKVEFNIAGETIEGSHSNHDLSHNVLTGTHLSSDELVNALSLQGGEYVTSHNSIESGEEFNTFCDYSSTRLVGASEKKAKNMVVAKETWATGEISKKYNLFNYAWHLKKQALEDPTIKSYVKLLNILGKRGTDLSDPERVKGTIAQQNWVNKRKQNAVNAYTHYIGMNGGKWNPPYYREQEKPIWIPKESEIDALISGTGLKTSVLLQCLKETGARTGEIKDLHWKEVDLDQRIIRITPEKGSNPRIVKVSESLVTRLGHVKATNAVKDPRRIFGKHYNSIYRLFHYQRKRLATKLGNERLEQITFHTIRHWYATKLYHETKDILYVQRKLGHKSLTSTMRYIHLAEAYFGSEEEEYVVKVAETPEQAIPLIEQGFIEASDFNGVKIFKIPKSRCVG